ncbi:hypothetical protein [Streptomyces sp. NBC_01233]|uniref:hypothetical protein n=1 Tax=Streptomyces sp. NBC_01233 TaxID=2903787 RepID=UPI002E1644D8|nr:hypothetical protein OG332_47495 [Streptomyces sp. NBC_01233]
MTAITEVHAAYEQFLAARLEFHARTFGARVEADLADSQDIQRFEDFKAASREVAHTADRTRRARRSLKRATDPDETLKRTAELHAAQDAEAQARATFEERKKADKGWATVAATGRFIKAAFWPAMAVLAALAAYSVAALSWKPAEDPAAAEDDDAYTHVLRRGAVGFGAIIGCGLFGIAYAILVIEGITGGVLVAVVILGAGLGLRRWLKTSDRHENAVLGISSS